MASLGDIGERELVHRIMGIVRPCPGGPGDDAAIIGADGGAVVCSDIMTFERHCPKGMSDEQFGWTVAAANLSDIAAMGAKPLGVLISLALPQDMDESRAYDIMSGADQCAEFCDTFIIGGDTKPGPGALCGTAVGTLDGRPPLTRSGARPGDIIAVTGSLGSPAAGYRALEAGMELDDAVFSLYVPIPRVKEGIALSESGAVTSCIDLSDGLAVAARTVCVASHVGMEIQEEFLPEGEGVSEVCEALCIGRRDLMLYWGGEYELMFTFDKDRIRDLYDRGIQFSIIGTVTNGDRPFISEGDSREEMGDGIY
jgi:thiamine-monophosphate kinase